jgi:hypothetical protein
MSTPKPIKNVFCTLDKALNDEIIFDSGVKLYLDPSYNPEWNATVSGKVYALPLNPDKEYLTMMESLSLGDEIAFSYRVVSDVRVSAGQAAFTEITKDSPYYKRFTNAKGEWITFVAMQGIIDKIWVGTYVDKFGDLIDGVQGSEHEAERWLSQFNFTTDNKLTHQNLIEFSEDVDFWNVKPSEIFAKKVGDEIVAIGDRVILEPIDVTVDTSKARLVFTNVPEGSDIKIRFYDRAVVISGEGEDWKKGDVVGFEEKYVEKYNLWGKDYFLIKKKRIHGKWVET